MAAGRSFGVASLAALIVVLALLLGFHWIWLDVSENRKICVLPKEHLSFDLSFMKTDSLPAFALQHPTIALRLATGDGHCVSF